MARILSDAELKSLFDQIRLLPETDRVLFRRLYSHFESLTKRLAKRVEELEQLDMLEEQKKKSGPYGLPEANLKKTSQFIPEPKEKRRYEVLYRASRTPKDGREPEFDRLALTMAQTDKIDVMELIERLNEWAKSEGKDPLL